MLRASKTEGVRKKTAALAALAERVGLNRQFRDHLTAAGRLAADANSHARRPFERFAPLRQLAGDEQLHTELAQLARELQCAWEAIRSDQDLRDEAIRTVRQFRRMVKSSEGSRSRRLGEPLLIAVAAGSAAALAAWRSSRRREQAVKNQGWQGSDRVITEERAAAEARL